MARIVADSWIATATTTATATSNNHRKNQQQQQQQERIATTTTSTTTQAPMQAISGAHLILKFRDRAAMSDIEAPWQCADYRH